MARDRVFFYILSMIQIFFNVVRKYWPYFYYKSYCPDNDSLPIMCLNDNLAFDDFYLADNDVWCYKIRLVSGYKCI